MRATTKIKASLGRIEETVAEATRLFINSGAVIEKILVNEQKWHEFFGSYDSSVGKVVATRRMEVSGLPVGFAAVSDAEVVLSVVIVEPAASPKASKK